MNIVEPIRKIKDIKKLRKILSENPRNELLFSLGINSGLSLTYTGITKHKELNIGGWNTKITREELFNIDENNE